MRIKQNNLKIVKKEGIQGQDGGTPTPKRIRVRRLKSIEDASKLIAKATVDLQNGTISIEKSKAIGFLAQVFISSAKQSIEETKLDEILSVRILLIKREAIRLLDIYIKMIVDKGHIDESLALKIREDFRRAIKTQMHDLKKILDDIKKEVSTRTNFKIRLIEDDKPDELKRLMLYRIRQLPESERDSFIQEILKENGW